MAKNLILTRARFCLLSVFEKEIKFHFVTLAKKKDIWILDIFHAAIKRSFNLLKFNDVTTSS